MQHDAPESVRAGAATLVDPGSPAAIGPAGREPAASDDAPLLAGRYRVRRVVGRGGFGIVYLADDIKIGRLVAIKRLYGQYLSHEQVYQRFLQEARIAGRLEHPNIIILYNIEEAGADTLMVMEYLGSGSLEDVMAAQPCIDPKSALRIMLGVLTGLEAAHDIMVVHRDIKPSNILFGINGTPKITDFGIARLPAQAGGDALIDARYEQGMMLGTPVYMSPEQARGLPVDRRSDLYSAGVLFYQMVTGIQPFAVREHATPTQMAETIETSVPQPPHAVRQDVPEAVSRIIERLIAKRAADRYESAAAVRTALVKAWTDIDGAQSMTGDRPDYPSALFWHSPAAILEDIIYLFLIDRVISPAERRELNIRIERLGISEQQARTLENKVRQRLDLPPV